MTDNPLDEIRAGIDRLDRRLVTLLAERERLVRRAGRLKADTDAVRAPGRVEQVVAKARAMAVEADASPDVVERTYRAMIAAFVDLELTTFRDQP
jgi:isochorismate pyruvate lyase